MGIETLIEYTAPDFSTNCKTNARYKRSTKTKKLVTKDKVVLLVPETLEVFNTYSEWQKHPVVFYRYKDADAYIRNEGEAVIFLADGTYTSIPFSSPTMDVDLYKQASRYNLNRGWLKVINP
ncbi:MAG: hypothetical protein Q8R47_06585 [Nanoarchaeota archaeon]|nr:hypothetical protein [Nanoarchaeota archaeon]